MALRLFRDGRSGVAVAVLMALAGGLAAPAAARDHDDIFLAVENGDVLPLYEILTRLRGQLTGEIVGVEIDEIGGQWIYELRLIDEQGRLYEVYVDGRSGQIQRLEEK
jgi:uncharacterized membrane protein YkoI